MSVFSDNDDTRVSPDDDAAYPAPLATYGQVAKVVRQARIDAIRQLPKMLMQLCAAKNEAQAAPIKTAIEYTFQLAGIKPPAAGSQVSAPADLASILGAAIDPATPATPPRQ